MSIACRPKLALIDHIGEATSWTRRCGGTRGTAKHRADAKAGVEGPTAAHLVFASQGS